MRHSFFVHLVVAAVVVASSSARAADDDVAPFGDRAPNVVVVDHMIGFVHVARVFPDLGGDTFSGNYFGVMGVAPIARVGYHRIVARRVSIGLGVHYADQSAAPGQVSGSPVKTWGLSPRIGFVLPLHRLLAIWLRGGVTYLSSSQPGTTDFVAGKSTPDESDWTLSLGAEAQAVFTPIEHVGFTFGPTIEWGIAGHLTQGTQDHPLRWRLYGVTFGLLVDF
jgi:hypothetical protein